MISSGAGTHKNRNLLPLLFLIWIASGAVYGGLFSELNAIAKSPYLSGASAGLMVYDLKSGEIVYSSNAGRALTPASNQKILVTSAALLEYGPEYTFSTELYAAGPVRGGVLEGSLVIKADGDPNISKRFNEEDYYRPFDQWVRAVEDAGIRKINGSIIIDDSKFDQEFFHPSWPVDQAHRWYAAEISAFTTNDSCIDLTVKPGRLGNTAVYSFKPFTSFIHIENTCKTVSGSQSSKIILFRKGFDIYLKGAIGVQSKGFQAEVTVHDPSLFTGAVFGRRLAAAGIQAEAVCRPEEPLKYMTFDKILDYKTASMSETIKVTNARSQNLYAEMLLKNLGHKRYGKGTFQNGKQAVEDILTEKGFDFSGITMDDGSGLSHKNLISPGKLTQVLKTMYDSEYRDAYVNSLAVPGDSYGTLRKRLKDVRLKSRIYGKSGYIDNVKALSGYVFRFDSRDLAFSFIVNNYQGKNAWNVTLLQEKLMKTLSDSEW